MQSVKKEIMLVRAVVCQIIMAILIPNVDRNASIIMTVRKRNLVLTINAVIHAQVFVDRIPNAMWQIIHRTAHVYQATLAIHPLLAIKSVCLILPFTC